MSAVVKVAIVDDHESVRLGLRAACQDAGYEVAGEAATVDALLGESAAAAVVADTGTTSDGDTEAAPLTGVVVVLDLSLGDGSSITSNVARLQGAGGSVLIHSIADRVAAVRESLAAGAAGVVPKSAPTRDVIASIATVARGGVLNNLEWASAIDADSEFADARLTQRERDVLHRYASGLPLKAVAEQLGIAASTAREYLDRVRDKYVDVGRPAPTKVDLLRRALEDGVLPQLAADADRAAG